MTFYKQYDNGLRISIKKIDGLLSVTAGILVKTGSINEDDSNNGISHFIEHTMFKGTPTRSAFEISDYIDRIGAQINAFTSKELTCYYTKSTAEHLEDSIGVLSDIFFNSLFEQEELDKEKGVVIEEIKMCEDTPEDLCLDLLAKGYHGRKGLGRTILGSEKNIKRFTKADIDAYMDKFYTADNVVISIAGNVDIEKAEKLCDKYFASLFKRKKSAKQVKTTTPVVNNLYKYKKIEQAHIGLCMKGLKLDDERTDAFSIANTVLGGGMSSRLFQKVREELGLAYSVYSYPSSYKDNGVLEIYAGVNLESRNKAFDAIIDEINRFKNEGITENEFNRGKEQLKSALILGRESTASQMLIYGKYILFLNKEYDFKERLNKLEKVTLNDVTDIIKDTFDTTKMATATIGRIRKPLI